MEQIEQNDMRAYIIMPRYGKTLENYFYKVDLKLSNISVYNIGIQILNNLEIIHKAGYVYNDLKLDNIMLDFQAPLPKTYTDSNCFKNIKMRLIDYGFVTKYVSKGKHISKHDVDLFQGNIMFGSVY